jgi:hypothetical protein
MPFALIPTTLGVCFVLIWMFIGGMVLRDGQLATHRDDSDAGILQLKGPHKRPRRMGSKRVVRAAS